jgi:hypothetical protein
VLEQHLIISATRIEPRILDLLGRGSKLEPSKSLDR